MPITTPVFKTGLSFSQNSSLRTNLRGILVGGTIPFDYAMQPYDAIYWRSFDPVNNIIVTKTDDGDPSWANKIKNAYSIGSGTGDPLIRYGAGRFSSAQSGTILIRVWMDAGLSEQRFILCNGLSAGYGLFCTSRGSVFFCHMDDLNDTIRVSTGNLAQRTWFHFGIKFDTIVDPLDPFSPPVTYVTSYQDGVQTQNGQPFSTGYVGVPSGDCSLFSLALLGSPFNGRITDFSFFEKQLTEVQIQTYAKVGVT